MFEIEFRRLLTCLLRWCRDLLCKLQGSKLRHKTELVSRDNCADNSLPVELRNGRFFSSLMQLTSNLSVNRNQFSEQIWYVSFGCSVSRSINRTYIGRDKDTAENKKHEISIMVITFITFCFDCEEMFQALGEQDFQISAIPLNCGGAFTAGDVVSPVRVGFRTGAAIFMNCWKFK